MMPFAWRLQKHQTEVVSYASDYNQYIIRMQDLIAVIAGVLPAFVLVCYIYLLDKHQREPFGWILMGVWYGVLCALAAIGVELILMYVPIPDDTLARAMYDSFAVAAIPEEGLKLIALMVLLRRNPYFDERMDCIVYAVCVSMGFAGMENIFYLTDNLDQLADVAIRRALLSVPSHFFDAVFMGYFLSLAIWGRPELRARNWVLTLLVPILLHGTFDACLMSMPLSDEVMAIAVVVFFLLGTYVWIGGHRRIMRVLSRDKRQMPLANPFKEEGSYNKDERSTPVDTCPSEDAENMDTSSAPPVTPSPFHTDTLAEKEQDEEHESVSSQGFFRHPFSFRGRIRRGEYGLSYLIYMIWYIVFRALSEKEDDLTIGEGLFILLSVVPMCWFFFAQSSKRCHDLGHSGWWILIPFYSLFLLFREGMPEANEYGDSPK